MPHDPTDREKPYFDEQLHLAYLATEYTCGRFVLKIGESHPGFNDFMARNGYSVYAFITAWNPRSQALPEAENLVRAHDFQQNLKAHELAVLPGAAHDPTGEWAREEGVFIFDAPTELILALATTWEQNAVVVGTRSGVPGLRWA